MDRKRKKSEEAEEASTSGAVRSVSKKSKVLSKLSLTVGIPNPENICYMSSVLQILANVKSYRDVILSVPTESSFDSDKILALQLMLTALLNQVGEVELSQCMINFCKVWGKNIDDEGDSAEFLMEVLSLLEDYLQNTNLEDTCAKLLYSTDEAGGKESVIYLNPGGKNTKIEQEIRGNFEKLASNLIFSINRVAETGTREISSMNFPQELNSRHLNKLSVSSKSKYPSYKLAAVIVHKFKLGKPHYVDFVKSGANWIQHDDEMVQKNSLKSVLETCGKSDGEVDQPLATMLIYTSNDNSCEVLIPAHLTERFYQLFLHRKQEPKLTVSIITGPFCITTHRLVEEDDLEVAQFQISEEDMEREVLQYLAPLFSFRPDSFHVRSTQSGYGGDIKVKSRKIARSETFSSLSCGSRSIRLVHFGGLELDEGVDTREQLNVVCIKNFRNHYFTSDMYFSRISGETVASLAQDSGVKIFTPYLVNGESVLQLEDHCPLSSLSQDGCIPVLVYDESGNLKEYLTSLFNTVRIIFISEKGERRKIGFNYDASTEEVYTEVGKRFNHASEKVQFQIVDSAGVPGNPIPSSEDLKHLLEKMHSYQQPRILRINLLDMALVEYEKLTNVTVTLCRLDLNEPKPVILKIDLTSDPSLLRLLEKVDAVEIPASEEVKWEFCVLNAGKVSALLDSSSPVKSHLDEVLGLVEVPVSGRVMSFFTYQENPVNRVGTPGIIAVSDLGSNDIETALEEVLQGEILNVGEFYFSMIRNSKFDASTFKQKCCLAEGPRPIKFQTCIGVELGNQ